MLSLCHGVLCKQPNRGYGHYGHTKNEYRRKPLFLLHLQRFGKNELWSHIRAKMVTR